MKNSIIIFEIGTGNVASCVNYINPINKMIFDNEGNYNCLNEDKCPTGTNYDKFTQACVCQNKWYNKTENSEIMCLSDKSDCPSDYPLLVFSTNECKKDNSLIYSFLSGTF